MPKVLNSDESFVLRDNITFGHEFNAERYHHALDLSALGPDLEVLPSRDMTEIGRSKCLVV